MTKPLKYLTAYSSELQGQIQTLIDSAKLDSYLLNKYPKTHSMRSNRALYEFVLALKNRFIKKSENLSKIEFDPKIHVIKNALGTHSYVNRVQGSKIKSKNEIRISTLFKRVPEEFLMMIVVHELAHLKEKQHNKAFYQLCCHMMSDYHQVEFDVRVYLTQLDEFGDVYSH